MSDPESELNRMRTAAWLELKDSPMKQKEISDARGRVAVERQSGHWNL